MPYLGYVEVNPRNPKIHCYNDVLMLVGLNNQCKERVPA